MRKYQTNLNNMITLRAKDELNKTESFGSQKQDVEISLCTVIFAMIAKFRYHSENSAIAKIENFAMVVIFAIIAKIWLQRKFRYHCEILAIIAKISLCHSEITNLLCCLLHPPACISHLRACYFFIPGLMKSMRIHTNSA